MAMNSGSWLAGAGTIVKELYISASSSRSSSSDGKWIDSIKPVFGAAPTLALALGLAIVLALEGPSAWPEPPRTLGPDGRSRASGSLRGAAP